MCIVWVVTHKIPMEAMLWLGGKTFTKLHTPTGMKDHLPCEVKRYRYIEDRLRENFELWGYREIRSPTIEFVEALSTGIGSELVDGMFKFQDSDGKMVALRPEMTAPAARMVTSRMSSIPHPIRLFYVCNVFRNSQSYIESGRELRQAGVELVGCNTPQADGEILCLLISTLEQIGLEEVRVDVGHASLLKELIQATGLDAEGKDVLKGLLGYRADTRLQQFMDQNDLPSPLQEAFLQLSSCRRLDQVSSVSPGSLPKGKTEYHLSKLLEVQDFLVDYGVEDLVFFDFSLTRKIEYYTGLVFEASVPNLGLPVGGGGRYDDLIQKFGRQKLPATGFAVEIERCLQALDSQGFEIPEDNKTRIRVSSTSRTAAMKVVNILRDAGAIALLNITNTGDQDDVKLAEIDYVVSVDPRLEKPLTVYDPQSETSHTMMLEPFLQSIVGRS